MDKACGTLQYEYSTAPDLVNHTLMEDLSNHCLHDGMLSCYCLINLDFNHTHWGRAPHTSFGNLSVNGSDDGLSPGRRQTIIRTNATYIPMRSVSPGTGPLSGGRLNKKDGLTRYGDSHVKDKTS